MRWLALACVIVAASTRPASAKRPPPMPVFADGRDLCNTGTTWTRITSCLAKRGTAAVLYETDDRKVVSFKWNESVANEMEIHLYVTTPKGWRRVGFLGAVHANQQLLSLAPLEGDKGPGIRLDIGQVSTTSVSFDRLTSVRGVLRFTQTHLCTLDSWACKILLTSCDTYVRGKLAYSFRGEVVWRTPRDPRLRGDTSRTGGSCTVSRAQLLEEDPQI